MEPVIKEDIGGTIFCYHYANETAATLSELSSVQMRVLKPGGSELIATTGITPDADGKMSISISADEAGSPGAWYRAHFQYVYDSQTYTQDIYFHIAPTDFDINFHYENLLGIRPDIGDYDPSNNAKYYRSRDSAVAELYGRLQRDGYEPWKILNRSALETPFGFLWTSYIFDGLSKHPGDSWDESAIKYRELYDEAYKSVNLIIDDAHSANVLDDEPRPIRQTRLVRG